MQVNLLKKVVGEIAGEEAVKIVDLLYGKKDINEFLIAKKLNLTINQTRNMLYKLSHLGILSSTRKKDKRKGWYIYFWTFNISKSLEVLANAINVEIANLNNQLENKKSKRYYKCGICGREVNEETALLSNFICTECGEVYGLADNTEAIKEIIKKIEKFQKEVKIINVEIEAEQSTKDKRLVRSIKRQEKKKKMLRAKKMKKTVAKRLKIKKELSKKKDNARETRKKNSKKRKKL